MSESPLARVLTCAGKPPLPTTASARLLSVFLLLTDSRAGPCTAYKEKLCHHRYRVSDEQAIRLSWLLSELADQPKQGITLEQEAWGRFRDDVAGTSGTRRELLPLRPPAHETGTSAAGTAAPGASGRLHVIDFLAGHARRVVDATLTDLHRFLRSTGASTADEAVARHWDRFEEAFGGGGAGAGSRPRRAWFPALRDGLEADVEACLEQWRGLMGGGGGGGGGGVQDYGEKVRIAYETWRAIKPRLPAGGGGIGHGGDDDYDPDLLAELLGPRDGLAAPELGRWELLKASWAFGRHHRRRFVWQMAGRQLQHIKALAAAGPVLVVPRVYAALRTDNLYVRRLVARVADGAGGVPPLAGREGPEDGGLEAGDEGMGELPWSSSPAGEEESQ